MTKLGSEPSRETQVRNTIWDIAYKYGAGVAMDKAEVVKWYRKAAEQGNADAKEALKKLGVENPNQATCIVGGE